MLVRLNRRKGIDLLQMITRDFLEEFISPAFRNPKFLDIWVYIHNRALLRALIIPTYMGVFTKMNVKSRPDKPIDEIYFETQKKIKN